MLGNLQNFQHCFIILYICLSLFKKQKRRIFYFYLNFILCFFLKGEGKWLERKKRRRYSILPSSFPLPLCFEIGKSRIQISRFDHIDRIQRRRVSCSAWVKLFGSFLMPSSAILRCGYVRTRPLQFYFILFYFLSHDKSRFSLIMNVSIL